jgi:hypothetical protein
MSGGFMYSCIETLLIIRGPFTTLWYTYLLLPPLNIFLDRRPYGPPLFKITCFGFSRYINIYLCLDT